MDIGQLSGYWLRAATRELDAKRDEANGVDLLHRRIVEKAKEEKAAEQKKDRDFEQQLLSIMLATQTQLVEFEVKLDIYDRATVQVLMHNTEQLEAVRKKIDTLLGEAYVLPDGRRVFRTRDGKQVFDEHGVEVKATEVDPASIDKRCPDWETFKEQKDVQHRLDEERQQLIDYQDKLDKSRDRLRSDKPVTESELKKMTEDLEASAPEAVKRELPQEKKADHKAATTPASTDLSMSDLDNMSESAPAPQPKAKAAAPAAP